MELPFHFLPTSNEVLWQCSIPSECCPCKKVRKQSKLEMIEILVVSQLSTLHSAFNNMLHGALVILSNEQREIRDLVPPWVGVLPVYHLWIKFVELQEANLLEA